MSHLYQDYSQVHRGIHQYFDKDVYDLTAIQYENLYRGYLPVDSDARILDIGCGTGQFLYFLKKQGYQNFYGIDMDPTSLDLVRKFISNNVEENDAIDFLSDKTAFYDFIIMNEVLEHIVKDQVIPLLCSVYKALKTGGMLICYVPNMENPFTAFTRYHDFTHTLGFTQNSLHMVLRSAGFENISIIPAIGKDAGLKKKMKRLLQKMVKAMVVKLFEYPNNGYFSCMRIFSVAIK